MLTVDGDYLTTGQAAHLAGVTPATVRQWVRRHHLTPATGPDGHPVRHPDTGETVYHRLDVAHAEYATRARARRTVDSAASLTR